MKTYCIDSTVVDIVTSLIARVCILTIPNYYKTRILLCSSR